MRGIRRDDALSAASRIGACVVRGETLVEPALRALDATPHGGRRRLSPVDSFLTYDEREAPGARLAGLRTLSQGA